MFMGCSSITLSTKDNRHFLARTMDFTMDPGSCLSVLPRGQTLRLSRAGNSVTLPYAILGMGTMRPVQRTLYDGVNEHGVMGAVLYYPGAVYAESGGGVENPVNPLCALLYLLGASRTLEELRWYADTMSLVDESNDILGHAPPLHFIFSDRTGRTLIIEPDAEGMTYYDQNIGVMTNAPAYIWHETNLRNYIGLGPWPAQDFSLGGKTLSPFGQGSGTWGLPGDYTGPSRFVRTAYMKANARPGENELDGMNQCLHILTPVHIPDGAVRNAEGRPDFTRYVSAICAESLTYYFTTYDCRRVSAASLTEEVAGSRAPVEYDWPGDADIRYLAGRPIE